MSETYADALQREIASLWPNDGWQVSHFVAVIGLQRVTEDGSMESDVVIHVPLTQAEYITDGLMAHAMRIREDLDDSSDDEDS